MNQRQTMSITAKQRQRGWCSMVPRLLLALGILFAFRGSVWAGDWPAWRGPTGLGYTDEKDLPLTWNTRTGENVLWKTLLHGGSKSNPDFTSPGWSSPIVHGDRIFLTTAIWP